MTRHCPFRCTLRCEWAQTSKRFNAGWLAVSIGLLSCGTQQGCRAQYLSSADWNETKFDNPQFNTLLVMAS